ncbi:hypothetical protein, partial [Dactylosporangium siamense]|uniref:hypothetical protein n=1 Tax=Dactylosporangium siamense TaxID=685454 RepID=UPI001EF3ABBD
MPLDQRAQGGAQRVDVELDRQVDRHGDGVVEGGGGELVQEPQSLLRVRQRQGRVPAHRHDRRRDGRRLDVVQRRGQQADRRLVEQRGQRQVGVEDRPDPGDDPR